MHLLAIDTETCALGPGKDRIVQFCAMELDGDLVERSRWTQLVNPGRHIPAAATAIHRITDDMVRSAPTFAQVAERLRRLVRPDTIFVAYNAGFDLGVLNMEFERCGVATIPSTQPVIDPLQIERRVTSRSLGPTYARYTGKPLEDAHRADADTLAMVEVLRHQRRVHADKLPTRLQDLAAVEGHPSRPKRRGHLYADGEGIVRLGFGRHRDRAAHEVPEYLAWMLEEDFPEPTKRRIRSLLTQQPLGLQA